MKMSLPSTFFRGGRNWNRNWNYSYRMMSSSTTSTTSTVMKSSSPWLMLRASHPDTTKLYSPAEKKVVSIKKETRPPAWAQGRRVKHMGCTQGWMASFNEDNQQAFLSNPITGRHIKLPHTDNWPSNIILTSSPDSHDCRAIITSNCINRAAMCFPAHKSPAWLPICDYTLDYEPKQVVYSARHNRLFCLTTGGQFECWDLDSPSLVWKAPWYSLFDKADEDEDEDDPGLVCAQYLAMDDRSGRLFHVFRNMWQHVRRDGSSAGPVVYGSSWYEDYPCKTIGFDVHEIDGYKGTATYMEGSLDGLAMFVGGNYSFALPAADLDLTPDSIYFVEDYCEQHATSEESEDGHDIGIFNYVDTKFSSMYYPSHVSQISRRIAPALWFTQMDV